MDYEHLGLVSLRRQNDDVIADWPMITVGLPGDQFILQNSIFSYFGFTPFAAMGTEFENELLGPHDTYHFGTLITYLCTITVFEEILFLHQYPVLEETAFKPYRALTFHTRLSLVKISQDLILRNHPVYLVPLALLICCYTHDVHPDKTGMPRSMFRILATQLREASEGLEPLPTKNNGLWIWILFCGAHLCVSKRHRTQFVSMLREATCKASISRDGTA